MSLRFIENTTKLSPIQMFIKSARDAEHRHYLKQEKKLRSLEYLYALRRVMGCLFTDSLTLNDFFEQFVIQSKNIKKQIEEEQMNLLKMYFENNQFNKEKFEQNYTALLTSLAQRFNEDEPSNIALKIIDKNELRNGELIQPDVSINIAEYKQRHQERSDELKFLTMYLATASDKELKLINKQRPNSELVDFIKNREDFIKLKSSYHHDYSQAIRNDQNRIRNKRKLA